MRTSSDHSPGPSPRRKRPNSGRPLEDTEREVGEQLKAAEANDQANNTAGLAAVADRTAILRAGFASMSADERRMPATIETALTEGGPITPGFRFADRDGPGVRRVFTPDYDYWRARRSRVEARGIQVEIGAAGSGLTPHPPGTLMKSPFGKGTPGPTTARKPGRGHRGPA